MSDESTNDIEGMRQVLVRMQNENFKLMWKLQALERHIERYVKAIHIFGLEGGFEQIVRMFPLEGDKAKVWTQDDKERENWRRLMTWKCESYFTRGTSNDLIILDVPPDTLHAVLNLGRGPYYIVIEKVQS